MFRMGALPQDILMHIFRVLDCKDVLGCSLVCKDWQSAAQSDSVWSDKIEVEFGSARCLPAASGSRLQAVQRFLHAQDAPDHEHILSTHQQYLARLSSLLEAVPNWVVTLENGTHRADSVLRVPQGIWLAFNVDKFVPPADYLNPLVVKVEAMHNMGSFCAAKAMNFSTKRARSFCSMSFMEQACVTGISTWETPPRTWPGDPTSQTAPMSWPGLHVERKGTLLMAVYLHFQQLLEASNVHLPQVLPLCWPQQWQGWILKQDIMFTAVVDFCRLDGTPVGAFCAQLHWQKDLIDDEDEPHLTWQLCDAGVGRLSLLGVSSTSTGQGGEQASSDSFEHAVQRIADWADNECMANLALYDRGGGLRLGRTGMEIWHSTVGEEEGHEGTAWSFYFIPDLPEGLSMRAFQTGIHIRPGTEWGVRLRTNGKSLGLLLGDPNMQME